MGVSIDFRFNGRRCSLHAYSEEEGEEQHDEQQEEPTERVEVAEARDVFGESDEEEDQEVEERRSGEESLQASPEVIIPLYYMLW